MRRLCLVLILLASACGDDDIPVFDSGIDTQAGDSGAGDASEDGAVLDGAVLDGAVLDGAVLDGALSDAGSSDGSVLDGMVVDSGDDAGPVDDTIYFEEFVVLSNPEWIQGVRIQTPVPLAAARAEVELRAIREFPGDVWVQDAAERFVLSAFDATFLATTSLEAGTYAMVIDYPGLVVPDPRTAHVTARLATPPRLAAEYATLVGTVAELERDLNSRTVSEAAFTVRAGHRYIAHGIAGMTTCLILRAADVEVLLRGDTVTPLHRWGAGASGGEVSDRVAPAPTYLDLDPGDYSLVAFNDDSIAHGLVVTVDEWALVAR